MSRYKISGAHIAHQRIDDEIIVVDLKVGAYYSISGGGTAIWEHLSTGFTADQTVDALSKMHSSDACEIRNNVKELLDTVLQDGLLIVASADDYPSPLATVEPPQTELSPMKPISVEKFTDLSEALMFDPIHDFDEAGWPNVQQDVAVQAQPVPIFEK